MESRGQPRLLRARLYVVMWDTRLRVLRIPRPSYARDYSSFTQALHCTIKLQVRAVSVCVSVAGYSALDLVTTFFRVVKGMDGLPENVKLDFIQQVRVSANIICVDFRLLAVKRFSYCCKCPRDAHAH